MFTGAVNGATARCVARTAGSSLASLHRRTCMGLRGSLEMPSHESRPAPGSSPREMRAIRWSTAGSHDGTGLASGCDAHGRGTLWANRAAARRASPPNSRARRRRGERPLCLPFLASRPYVDSQSLRDQHKHVFIEEARVSLHQYPALLYPAAGGVAGLSSPRAPARVSSPFAG